MSKEQAIKSRLNRREFMVSSGLAATFPGLAHARVVASDDGPREDLVLHYDKPAGARVEALPIGNGKSGAMVFGRVAQERLQLNEEAADLADSDMIARPRRQTPHSTAGDLLLDFTGLSAPANYRRWLDIDTAVASTRMRIGSATHKREAFASAPDQIVVLRLTVDAGAMDFDLGYRHPAKAEYAAPDDKDRAMPAQMPGANWDRQETLNREQRPANLSIRPDGEGALLIEGRNNANGAMPSGLRYAVRVKVVGDGRITPRDDRIQVRGASAVTLLIATATSYVSYADASGDAAGSVRTRTEAAARKTYEMLKADHVAAHQAMLRRLSIRLSNPVFAD